MIRAAALVLLLAGCAPRPYIIPAPDEYARARLESPAMHYAEAAGP
jgi:hypothetical protein